MKEQYLKLNSIQREVVATLATDLRQKEEAAKLATDRLQTFISGCLSSVEHRSPVKLLSVDLEKVVYTIIEEEKNAD